ncbi:MAG: hypothetical protein PVF91_00130 [Chromatiales bacterium]|jgi:hypothetical protein
MRSGAPNEGEREVMDAAALLDISEYDLLCLAYRRWYGRDAGEVLMERVFAAYMLGCVVPHWARFHAREILAGHRPAPAPSGRPGGATSPPRPVPRALVVLMLLGVLALVLGAFFDARLWPAVESCYFPPCY